MPDIRLQVPPQSHTIGQFLALEGESIYGMLGLAAGKGSIIRHVPELQAFRTPA